MFVASTEFIAAAETQADALGFPAARVFVEHPIQDRTDDEIRALADAAVPHLIGALTLDDPATPAGGETPGAAG